VKTHDTVLVNLETGKIENKCKFDVGALCMIKGGNNMGRVGIITTREKHPGSYEIIHVKDETGTSFATRISNVMVIGDSKAWISLPKGKGIKLNNLEDRAKRMA
jgi:small subunit ribosomal protein S4e